MSKTLIPKSNKAREGEESSTRERDEKRERNLLPSFSQKRERREREREDPRARDWKFIQKRKNQKKNTIFSRLNVEEDVRLKRTLLLLLDAEDATTRTVAVEVAAEIIFYIYYRACVCECGI